MRAQGPTLPDPHPPPAYAELETDYAPCPLVRSSRAWAGARLACAGPAAPVVFTARGGGPPPPAALAEGVVELHRGDGESVHRLERPPCEACFFPLLRARGLPPLEASIAEGRVRLRTLAEDPAALRDLLRALRETGARPRLTWLARGAPGPAPAAASLTPRQAEVLDDAWRAGYFHGREVDVPARARALGVASSTYYAHLRSATQKVLRDALARRARGA